MRLAGHLGGTLVLVMLAGCTTPNVEPSQSFPRFQDESQWPRVTLFPMALEPARRLSMPPVDIQSAAEHEPLFSFVISNMEIHQALRLFARAYDLNFVVDSDVVGVIDVEFHDTTLDQALSMMLGPLDYYWQRTDGLIRVRSFETRQFQVDYLRLIRTGTGSSTATVSSGSSSSGGDGSSDGEDNGSIVIGHSDEIEFWNELEIQLTSLLGPQGRVVINQLSGTVHVSDQHRYVRGISDYIAHVNRSIHRQVNIEVRILEVALDDTTAFGVDWSRLSEVMQPGTTWDFSILNGIDNPAGGLTALSSVFNLSATNRDSQGNIDLAAVVTALEQQGDVEIVSQPHVRTLNNQTSLIKVGTDRTFFRREQSTDSTSAGSLTTSSDVPQVVTEGVVLSITPQIGNDGWITMDISPVVTRVSSVSTVEGSDGVVQSSAPNLDVAQVSSLVRARSGDTIVIGGLIQTVDSKTSRGIPGLNSLGPVGRLFGGRYTARIKKELVMVLTPTIVASRS